MLSKLLIIVLCVSFFCQCSSNISADSELNHAVNKLPKSWANISAAQKGASTDWVKIFGDSELRSLIKKIWNCSPDLKILSERIKQAQIIEKATKSSLFPSLSYAFEASREKNVILENPFVTSTYSTFQNGVIMDWEIDLWKRIRYGGEKNRLLTNELILRKQALKLSLSAKVAETWFTIKEKDVQIKLLNEALSYHQGKKAYLLKVLDAGGEVKFLKAQLRDVTLHIKEVKSQVLAQENARNREEAKIAQLLGDGTYQVAVKSKGLPLLDKHMKVGIPSEVLLKRPDIIALERRYRASQASVKEARAALYPRFSLTGIAGMASNSLKNVIKSDFGVWQLASGVTMPLLNRGELKSNVKLKKSESAIELITLHQSVLSAFREVNDALVRNNFLLKELKLKQQAVDVLEKSFKESESLFDLGKTNLSRRNEYQFKLLDAKSRLEALKLLKILNTIDIYLKMGGGN